MYGQPIENWPENHRRRNWPKEAYPKLAKKYPAASAAIGNEMKSQ